MKKYILTFLLVLVSSSIFIFSSESGVISNNTSDRVTIKIIDVYSKITNKRYTEQEKQHKIIELRLLIRKTAHFTLYFILGIIVYSLLDSFNIKYKGLYTLLIILLFPRLDEYHQHFTPGRTAALIDTWIDTIGSIVGIWITYYIKRKKKEFKL